MEAGPAGSALRLFVRAGGWLLALGAEAVERIALPEDASWVERRSAGARDGNLGSLAVAGECYSAWDLGLLLGQGPVDAAWVLLRLPHQPRPLPLALRVGPCQRVAPLPGAPLGLPAGAFRRRHPLAGAFLAEDGVGLVLDTVRLWSADERAEAEECLARATALLAARRVPA